MIDFLNKLFNFIFLTSKAFCVNKIIRDRWSFTWQPFQILEIDDTIVVGAPSIRQVTE